MYVTHAPQEFVMRTQIMNEGWAMFWEKKIMLELFNNHCMNIAEQMGAVLENTAHSVNIKERRDFSCALFDARGQLVAEVADEVEERVTALAASLIVGDPFEAATEVGPLIDRAAASAVESFVSRARQEGLTIATGGGGPRPRSAGRPWPPAADRPR